MSIATFVEADDNDDDVFFVSKTFTWRSWKKTLNFKY